MEKFASTPIEALQEDFLEKFLEGHVTRIPEGNSWANTEAIHGRCSKKLLILIRQTLSERNSWMIFLKNTLSNIERNPEKVSLKCS